MAVIKVKVGDVVMIEGDVTEYVVNRVQSTLKNDLPVRAQIDMMSVEEVRRRYYDLEGLLNLAARL